MINLLHLNIPQQTFAYIPILLVYLLYSSGYKLVTNNAMTTKQTLNYIAKQKKQKRNESQPYAK